MIDAPLAAAALLRYLAAYERRDLAAIATLLAPDACLQDWNIAVQGREAVLAETQANFDAARSIAIRVVRQFAGEGQAAAQLHIVVDDHVTLDVVDVLSFDAAGRITAIRAFKG